MRVSNRRVDRRNQIMVPKGSDTRSNFTRVVGGVDILVQAITYLATVNRLEESLQVRAGRGWARRCSYI